MFEKVLMWLLWGKDWSGGGIERRGEERSDQVGLTMTISGRRTHYR